MEKLPRDINLNIFSRLPLRSVIQSSVVSKSWLDIIKDPSFVKLHASLSKPDPLQLIMTHRTYGEQNIISLTPLDYKHNLLIADATPIDHIVSGLSWVFVGTCNGLLCFTSIDKEEEITMLCNPISREHIFLPKPSIHLDKYTATLAFGFDKVSKSYKFVRILLPHTARTERLHRHYNDVEIDSSRHVKTEVFTLGGNNSWREVQVEDYFPSGNAVYVNGSLYWLAQNLDYKVLSFDLGIENFKLIPSPSFGGISSVKELRGCLSVIDLSAVDFVDIWILKDEVNYSWEFTLKIPVKNYSITRTPVRYRRAARIKPMLIDIHEFDGSVVTWLSDKLFAYNKRTFSSKIVELKGFPVWLDWEVHDGYRGSLVTLENLGAVSEEQKNLVRFVSDDEMTCHLLAKGGDFSRHREPCGDCAALVAGFKKHGMLFHEFGLI